MSAKTLTALPHIQAMAAYALADLGGPDTISLAQNESAFPPSPTAVAAGRQAMDQMALYPDPDWTELRRAIADVHALDPSHILCGAGSMELIGALIRAYAEPSDHVLGTDYGYAFVAAASAQVQARYVKAHEPDLTVSVNHILNAITNQTKIVFLCNPGNPTGTLIPNADILRLRADLPDHILLVIDQAYAEFCDDVAKHDPAPIFDLTQHGNTVITRTLSKAYGLAGARVGWGVFPPAVACEVRKILNPNNISLPAQMAATAAVRNQAYMKQTVTKTAGLRDDFAVRLRKLGLTIPASHTNFVLIRFANEKIAQGADQALRRENLLMRGMGGYALPDCLRATICAAPVMTRAGDVLERYVS